MKKLKGLKRRKNNVLFKKGLTRQGKLLLMAIGMAVCIGIVLGVISLQMTKQDGTVTYDKSVAAKKEHTENTSTIKDLDAISFFVIQGGVFSEEENAKLHAAQFEKHGYPSFNWVTEDQVYVFTGIASEESEAELIAKEMQEDGMEVYVKKQEVDSVEMQMTEADHQWLQQFLALWQESVTNYSAGEDIQVEKWKKLMDQKMTADAEVKVVTQLYEMWEEDETLNGSRLLELMYTYEETINGDS